MLKLMELGYWLKSWALAMTNLRVEIEPEEEKEHDHE